MEKTQKPEDIIYILVDYKKRKSQPNKKDTENFKREVLEESLGYRQNCSPNTYVNEERTSTLKVIGRDITKTMSALPLYLLAGLKESKDYNISLVLHIPLHKSIESRDIKGEYSWITNFLDSNGINFLCLNPPKEDRSTPRIRVKSGGLEKELSVEEDKE